MQHNTHTGSPTLLVKARTVTRRHVDDVRVHCRQNRAQRAARGTPDSSESGLRSHLSLERRHTAPDATYLHGSYCDHLLTQSPRHQACHHLRVAPCDRRGPGSSTGRLVKRAHHTRQRRHGHAPMVATNVCPGHACSEHPDETHLACACFLLYELCFACLASPADTTFDLGAR